MKRRFRVQNGTEISPFQKDELVKGALLTHMMLMLQESKSAPVKHISVPSSWQGSYKEEQMWDVFRAVSAHFGIELRDSDIRKIGLVFSNIEAPIAVADVQSSIDLLTYRDGVW